MNEKKKINTGKGEKKNLEKKECHQSILDLRFKVTSFPPSINMSAKGALVKLVVEAGKAAPAPPVGPALGSKGVKAIDFCKEFNARTAIYNQGVPIPVIIQVKPDRTFTFEMKSPPTSWLLMKAAGVEKGSGKALKEPVGEVSLKHIWEIAKIKKTDDRHKSVDLKAIVGSVISTAKVIGIKVVP